MYKILLTTIALFVYTNAFSQLSDKLFDNLLQENASFEFGDSLFRANFHELCDSVLSQGKASIPLLIEKIDDHGTFAGLSMTCPWSSYRPEVARKSHYIGIINVYLIRFILRRDVLNKPTFKESNIDAENTHHKYQWYYLNSYYSNLLANKHSKSVLTYKEVKKLKEFMQDWWDVNKHKSLKELKRDYSGKPLLEGSEFIWI